MPLKWQKANQAMQRKKIARSKSQREAALFQQAVVEGEGHRQAGARGGPVTVPDKIAEEPEQAGEWWADRVRRLWREYYSRATEQGGRAYTCERDARRPH